MIAKELLAYLNSGLILWGQNEDGELEWVGTEDRWSALRTLLNKYE